MENNGHITQKKDFITLTSPIPLKLPPLKETAALFKADMPEMGDISLNMTRSGENLWRCDAAMGSVSAYFEEENPEYAAKGAIYSLLSEMTGAKKGWGSLTGVKPLKLFTNLIERGKSMKEAEDYLRKSFMVSEGKLGLLAECYANQKGKLYPAENGALSLYIHIPLCPARCSYCSFPSAVTSVGSFLCEDYLCALLKEIAAIRELTADRHFDSIYIGGGTPSIFSNSQLEKLFDALEGFNKIGGRRNSKSKSEEFCEFQSEPACEFTFEGGRPDTLPADKLKLLKERGVSRISVNPQSANDATLKAINRLNSFEDFARCMQRAQAAGFGDINCDLIFGLEEETPQDCLKSLNKIIALKPTCITLHTLCKKRTSDMEEAALYKKEFPAALLQDEARERLREEGYYPYYTYRQKNAVDSAENTGYSLKGHECIYNIRMMGEKQTIIAAGAGSTTKICYPETGRFENFYNPKNLKYYIEGIEGVVGRKKFTCGEF